MPLALLEAGIVAAGLIDEVGGFALQSTGALANPIRRRVVSLLLDQGVLQREELAEAIAADESTSQSDPERIEIALHHNHLPKLDQEHLIEYDQRNGDVVLWEDPATINEMLDAT